MAVYFTAPEGAEAAEVYQISRKREMSRSIDFWISAEEYWNKVILVSDTEGERERTGERVEIPGPLGDFVRRYRLRVPEAAAGFRGDWRVKGAALWFVYGDVYYVLNPGVIGASQEVFDALANDMKRDLERIGCPVANYQGMID